MLSSFQGKEWGPVNLLESLTLPIGKAQEAYRAAWGYLSQAFDYAFLCIRESEGNLSPFCLKIDIGET